MDSYEGRDLEVLADMPNYYGWILDVFLPHVRGDVLEYGAGVGTISERLLRQADTLTLVEPSANLVQLLKKRFASETRVGVVEETLERHTRTIGENRFDTIVMVNVLEHIEADETALSELYRILRPGGRLLLFVPALQVLMSKLDAIHGHFRRYYKADLERKVKSGGLTVLTSKYFDTLGVASWFLLNTVMRRTEFNPRLIKINDAVVIPITRAIESIASAPFGKNVILVAGK